MFYYLTGQDNNFLSYDVQRYVFFQFFSFKILLGRDLLKGILLCETNLLGLLFCSLASR